MRYLPTIQPIRETVDIPNQANKKIVSGKVIKPKASLQQTSMVSVHCDTSRRR